MILGDSDNRLLTRRLGGLGQRPIERHHTAARSHQPKLYFRQAPGTRSVLTLMTSFEDHTAIVNRFAVLISYAVFEACTIMLFPLNGSLVKSS